MRDYHVCSTIYSHCRGDNKSLLVIIRTSGNSHILIVRNKRQQRGPIAEVALAGWSPEYDAGVFGELGSWYTWNLLESYIEDNNLPVTMEQIGEEIALAHAESVITDNVDTHNLLNPEQTAQYHHEVFAQHDIPPHLFGGTRPIPFVQVPAPASTYSYFWCRQL